MHQNSGPGDDDIVDDDDFDDSVLPKDCILYFPGAGFYCIRIVGLVMMILLMMMIMMIVFYPNIVYFISLGLDSIASA